MLEHFQELGNREAERILAAPEDIEEPTLKDPFSPEHSRLFVDRETDVPEYQEIIAHLDRQQGQEQKQALETRREEQQPEQDRTRKRGLDL